MTLSIAELHDRAGVQDDHSAASASHGHVTSAGVVEWHSHTPAKDAFNCPHYPQGCVAAGAPRCRCLADADHTEMPSRRTTTRPL